MVAFRGWKSAEWDRDMLDVEVGVVFEGRCEGRKQYQQLEIQIGSFLWWGPDDYLTFLHTNYDWYGIQCLIFSMYIVVLACGMRKSASFQHRRNNVLGEGGACCTVYLGKTIAIQATFRAVWNLTTAYPPAETNSSPLKMDGWNLKFPFGAFGLFSEAIWSFQGVFYIFSNTPKLRSQPRWRFNS